MLNVPDVSSPSHVAPSVPATFDINRRSRRNDRLDPMMCARSRPQVQVRGGVGYGCGSRQNRKHQTHCQDTCQNGDTELHGCSPPNASRRYFAAAVERAAEHAKSYAAIQITIVLA